MTMSRRTLLVAFLIGLVGMVFAIPAMAQDSKNAIRIVGQLTKIEGKALTITDGGKETVVTCNDATKVGRDSDKATLTFADLKVGQPVRSYYDKTNNIAIIVRIADAPTTTTAKPPPPTRIAGQLTKIEGKTLTITEGGKETVVTCNDATKVIRDGDKTPAKFEDLQVGQSVRSYYKDSIVLAIMIAKPVAP
jgi:hypothetical protein